MIAGWLAIAGMTGLAGLAVGWRFGLRRNRTADLQKTNAANEQVIEISTLAGGLAHEIRNPLSTLKVNLQLLGEDWNDESIPPAELRRRSLGRLATLQAEATRLHHIVDEFLRLVGRQELRLVTTDINEVIRQFVEFYEPQAMANKVVIRTALSARPLPCRIDVDLCKQVLLNVCINAQEAMPKGGELAIRTREDAGRRACIEIADTGTGLDPQAAERIFEPYYSTKPGGTGLGLALTRRIVRAHGGTIQAAGRPGEGTTFTITLPLAAR
ncbi:MAG: sensor histidine kinase [Phycisphaerae bacterium]